MCLHHLMNSCHCWIGAVLGLELMLVDFKEPKLSFSVWLKGKHAESFLFTPHWVDLFATSSTSSTVVCCSTLFILNTSFNYFPCSMVNKCWLVVSFFFMSLEQTAQLSHYSWGRTGSRFSLQRNTCAVRLLLEGVKRWRHVKQSQINAEVLGWCGLAMRDICMLVSEECTEGLVNNPLCSGSAYLTCWCCSLPICSCALSHRSWGNMDCCIIMHYLWSFPHWCWLIWLEICRR